MNAKEMLEKVQELKEQCLLSNFYKPKEVDDFFEKYWMQILDILDDALYEYLQKH